MIFFKRNAAFLSLASLLLLSGCRFGNYADKYTPIPQKETFTHSELFYTNTKSFEVKAVLDNNGATQILSNTNVPLSAAPSTVLNTFTNLLYFRIVNNNDKTPIFQSWDEGSYMITKVANDRTIEYDSFEGVSNPPWYQLVSGDNYCGYRIRILTDGDLDRSKAQNIDLGGGETLSINGHASINFTQSIAFTDECQSALQTLAQCYANGVGCSNSDLTFSHALLDLYVNQSGVLNVNDVSKLKSLEYTVHFE